jgi:hypothetical protein
MTTRKRNNSSRVTLADQDLMVELKQFTELANELVGRVDEFMGSTSVRCTVLSQVVSAHRSAKACSNHLRAASLLAASDA